MTSVLDPNCRFRLESNRDKIASILELTSRSHLKIVFFGLTSSGKSSVINALLGCCGGGGEGILPSGLGHTTSCFIEIAGTNRDNPTVTVPDGDGKQREIAAR